MILVAIQQNYLSVKCDFLQKGVSCSNIFAINDNISTIIQTPHMYFKKARFYKIKNLKYLSWRHYMLEIQTWKLSKLTFTGNNGTALVKLQGPAISYFQTAS